MWETTFQGTRSLSNQEDEVDKLVQALLQQPTTLWDGHPVIGFKAETYLDDLRQLVSSTSIRCGLFQLPLSTRIGNR